MYRERERVSCIRAPISCRPRGRQWGETLAAAAAQGPSPSTTSHAAAADFSPRWQRAPLPKGSGGFLWPVALLGDGRAGAGAAAPGIMAAAAAGLSSAVSDGRRWWWDLQRRKGLREVRLLGRGPLWIRSGAGLHGAVPVCIAGGPPACGGQSSGAAGRRAGGVATGAVAAMWAHLGRSGPRGLGLLRAAAALAGAPSIGREACRGEGRWAAGAVIAGRRLIRLKLIYNF
jgi:hypothetical protein